VGQKDVIFENEPEKLLKTRERHPKTNRNEPKKRS